MAKELRPKTTEATIAIEAKLIVKIYPKLIDLPG